MVPVSVELVNVGRRYPGNILFSGVNSIASPGDCLAITGRNGSGKSTLIKIVAGLDRPDEGSVHFWRGGREMAAEQRRHSMGMVSPEVIWYKGLSGRENLRFIARLRSRRIDDKDLSGCLEQVGLSGEHGRPVWEYSTGMVQRLRFAALLLLDAPVWLLDEPSTNLDAAGKAMVASLVDEARRRDRTVLIATNEPEEAAYAEQIIHLG